MVIATSRQVRADAFDGYLVECCWPGMSIADVDRLDRRTRVIARRERRRGSPVHYLGSIFVPADEVVLFEFLAGSAAAVVATSAQAGLPSSASFWRRARQWR